MSYSSICYCLRKISGRNGSGECVLPYPRCWRLLETKELGGRWFLAGWELTSRLLWRQRAVCVCVCACVRVCVSAWVRLVGVAQVSRAACVEHFLETAFVLLQVLEASVCVWTFRSLLTDALFVSFSRPLILGNQLVGSSLLSALQQKTRNSKRLQSTCFPTLLYDIVYLQSKLLSVFDYMSMKATETASHARYHGWSKAHIPNNCNNREMRPFNFTFAWVTHKHFQNHNAWVGQLGVMSLPADSERLSCLMGQTRGGRECVHNAVICRRD